MHPIPNESPPVCLINPPSPFLLDERVFMPLGILRVAAVLRDRGFRVDFLDLSGIKNPQDVLRAYCGFASVDTIYGITVTTPQLPAAVKIRDTIKSINQNTRIILGGPHVTLTNAARKREIAKKVLVSRADSGLQKMRETFDVLVAGDGEEAIFRAIGKNAPKIIDADDPMSSLFLKSQELSVLPFPARNLIDVGSYHHYIDGKRALNIILQLGCPFGCGFCGGRLSPSFRKIRLRSTENVIDEVRHVYETYGVEALMFHDDELNVNPKFIELLRGLIDLQKNLGVKFHFRGFIKSQLLTEDQASLMYEAGFRIILVAFEAADERILRNINKSATLEENTRCMEIAHKYGLKVKALMSIGHPGESVETVNAVKDWLIKVKPHDFDITVITTYCGTPYHDDAVFNEKLSEPGRNIWTYTTHGDNLHGIEIDFSEVEGYYKGKPDEGYVSYVFTDYLKPDELVKLRDWVEREVRTTLNIPYYSSGSAVQYEHSMGQGNVTIPDFILRSTADQIKNP